MGYIVGKFPEEKQVVTNSTVEASSIEEGLCALLGVPALKRLDASGAVQESRVRWPSAIPIIDDGDDGSGGGGSRGSRSRSGGSGGCLLYTSPSPRD